MKRRNKIKIGDTVYYLFETGTFRKVIRSGTVQKIVYDLSSKKKIYTIKVSKANLFFQNYEYDKELSEEYVYSNPETLRKEWREDILAGEFEAQIDNLNTWLCKIYSECEKHWEGLDETERVVSLDSGATITGEKRFSSLYIPDIGDVGEVIKKLQKEVDALKKAGRNKNKTKKVVKNVIGGDKKKKDEKEGADHD